MKKAKFGVLFFGMGLSMTRGKHMNSAAALTLAAEMNAFTKFVAMPMRGHGNVTGADVILRYTTGFPFGINLCRGYPRFNPGEFSTVDLLVRGDNDATLVIGADPGATMPQPAIDHLARTPTIVLDPKVTHTSRLARVHITTAATGISAPGTVYRMDEIPLPLRPPLKSPYPTDEVVVRRISQAVREEGPVAADDDHRSIRCRSPSGVAAGLLACRTFRQARRPAATPNQFTDLSMLRIQGGKVYDPANGISGRVQDICIDNGKIVASVASGRVIDATGMIVFPGGVDVHTHVAGAALNFARGLIPEQHRKAIPHLHAKDRRAGIGGATPSTFATGYLYAGMGFTTVNEAAMPIMSAKHTHEELRDTPIVDKTSLVLMANNEIVMDLLEAGDFERAKDVVAWQVWASKAYGIKAVNPGGVAAWKWGKNARQLGEPVEGYKSVTPGSIVASLARIADELRLPHPLHLHCNNLGVPGNISTTLDTMKRLEGNRAHGPPATTPTGATLGHMLGRGRDGGVLTPTRT